jgi:hypothetical protein
MTQAKTDNSTTSRRRFLTVAAAASAVSAGALAAAAMSATLAASQDDSELLRLEKLIFEQHEEAKQHDYEIIRLQKIWIAEFRRLADEVDAGRSTLTNDERWALVLAMPEAIESARLQTLQNPFHEREDAYTAQMFATPAHTPEGRRAKVIVLLRCVMGNDWCSVDEETDYPEMTARRLLIEFVGGEPGEMLRGQFA